MRPSLDASQPPHAPPEPQGETVVAPPDALEPLPATHASLVEGADVRAYPKGTVANPRYRKIINQNKFLGLTSALVDYVNGVPVSRQEVAGVVSGLGNVIDGTCRCEILHDAGLPFLAVLRPDIDTPEKELAFFIVTDQRSDRDPLEKAHYIVEWKAATKSNSKQACEKFGMSESGLCRLLKAMDMPAEVLGYLEAGDLTLGHLAELRKIKDPAAMAEMARRAVERKLSTKQLREQMKSGGKRERRPKMITLSHGGVTLSCPEDISIKDCDDAIHILQQKMQDLKKNFNKDQATVGTLAKAAKS